MSWGYEQQPEQYYETPRHSGGGGKTFAIALVTSIITSAAVFFGLRELEGRGMLRSTRGGVPSAVVDVPSLVGLKPEQARELLRARNLMLTIGGEKEDQSQPAGAILAQAPLAGSQATAGTGVQVILAKVVQVIVLPNVAGLRPEDAARHLQGIGLKMAAQQSAPHDSIAAGAVVGTQPAVGTTVAPQTAVSLVVSAGPTGAPVPKVVGMKLAKAKKLLEGAGFKVGKTTYTYDRHFGELVVLKQEPAEGARAAAGATISLVVNEPG
jgi:serine/threonine-protein kinase